MLVDAWNDPEIARWNPIPPDPSMEFASSWIAGTSSQTVVSVGIDVVIVDVSDRVLGEIGLQVDPRQQIAEVGFWIAGVHRGRGHGRALLRLSIDLAEHLELLGLVAMTDAANSAAVALLTANGWAEIPTKSARRAFAQQIT